MKRYPIFLFVALLIFLMSIPSTGYTNNISGISAEEQSYKVYLPIFCDGECASLVIDVNPPIAVLPPIDIGTVACFFVDCEDEEGE